MNKKELIYDFFDFLSADFNYKKYLLEEYEKKEKTVVVYENIHFKKRIEIATSIVDNNNHILVRYLLNNSFVDYDDKTYCIDINVLYQLKCNDYETDYNFYPFDDTVDYLKKSSELLLYYKSFLLSEDWINIPKYDQILNANSLKKYGIPFDFNLSVIANSAAGFIDLSDKLTFDAAKANALLDDAGWKTGGDGIRAKDGERLALTVYESLPQPQNKEVLQLVAQQWRQVGVALSVKAGDAGSRTLDNLDPLKTPLTVSEVGRADPDVVKSMFYPANRDALLQKGGSSDKVKSFRDDKLNELLVNISAEVDPQKRLQLTGDAQRYLLDNAYVIPIFEEPQVFAGAPWLKGVNFEAVGRPSFYGAWIEKH